MDIATLTEFFKWCSILNGGLLIFWMLFCCFAPDLIYRLQTRFFPMQREHFDIVIYSFLGLFKIFFLGFNLTPYLALLIIG